MFRLISLRLPDALLRRLDRAGRARGKARSELIREAIEAHLQARGRARPAELVRSLLGSVKGAGPADLATRHAHYLRQHFRGRKA
ncbi:MAG: ribbon-helix-helix protein, CopG family [Planctomycetota bacterium]